MKFNDETIIIDIMFCVINKRCVGMSLIVFYKQLELYIFIVFTLLTNIK